MWLISKFLELVYRWQARIITDKIKVLNGQMSEVEAELHKLELRREDEKARLAQVDSKLLGLWKGK